MMALVKQGGVEFRVKYHAFFHAQIFLQSPSSPRFVQLLEIMIPPSSYYASQTKLDRRCPGNLARLIRLVEPGN